MVFWIQPKHLTTEHFRRAENWVECSPEYSYKVRRSKDIKREEKKINWKPAKLAYRCDKQDASHQQKVRQINEKQGRGDENCLLQSKEGF